MAAGQHVVVLGAPKRVSTALGRTPDVMITERLAKKSLLPADMVVFFVEALEDLERRISLIASRLHPAGDFWIAWRSRSAAINENVVRRIGMAAGLVDVKQCDLDGGWHGLRMVMRAEIAEAVMYRAVPRNLPARTRRASQAPVGAGSTLRRARAAKVRR